MQPGKTLGFRLCYAASNLPQKGVNKQSATHADAAVNAPYRQLDPHFLEGLSPGQDMLVNAVYQRAVQIEQEGRTGFQWGGFVHVRDPALVIFLQCRTFHFFRLYQSGCWP
jgi:hypothetical protein